MVTNGKGAGDLFDQIVSHSHYEHVSDAVYLDGDLSLEEHLLAARFPKEYDLNVNGIRRIPVQDDDAELRYVWKDGKLIKLKEVF